MTSHYRNQLLILVGSVLLAVLILVPTFAPPLVGQLSLPEWWSSKKIKLGLDLRGGTYLVLGVQTNEAVKSQLNGIASAIKAELSKERIGIVKAKASGDRTIQITMLNDKGLEKLESYISSKFPELVRVDTATEGGRFTVNFKINEAKAAEIEKDSVDQAIETIRNRVDQYGVAEPTIQRSGEKRIVVQLPGESNIENIKRTIGSVAKLEFRLVADPAHADVETVSLKNKEGGSLTVEQDVLMTGDSIRSAGVGIDPQKNQVEVNLVFNSIGSQLFARITEANVDRSLAIVLDGVVQSWPNINEPITGGSAQITGRFTMEEAHRLAIVLRSGALPAPLTFEEQRTVGASLGADSITRGVNASLIGSAIVLLFMIFYYSKSGMLAIACLIVNLLWLLALLALFGSTLTVPGIAGLALTVGMAVDSNIIIFERIREELKLGASPGAAIEAGFDRAHWTILDANITTLLSGLILYGFGTGPVKGFAVTLSIGIVTTVAAALFASRLGFHLLSLRRKDGSLSI